FGLCIGLRKIGVVFFQHLVLIAMAELAAEGGVFVSPLAVGVSAVAFYRALAQRFVRMSLCRVGHRILLVGQWRVGCGLRARGPWKNDKRGLVHRVLPKSKRVRASNSPARGTPQLRHRR